MNYADDIEYLKSQIKTNDNTDIHYFLKEDSENEKQESNLIKDQILDDEILPNTFLEDGVTKRDIPIKNTNSKNNSIKKYKTYPLEFKKKVIADVI